MSYKSHTSNTSHTISNTRNSSLIPFIFILLDSGLGILGYHSSHSSLTAHWLSEASLRVLTVLSPQSLVLTHRNLSLFQCLLILGFPYHIITENNSNDFTFLLLFPDFADSEGRDRSIFEATLPKFYIKIRITDWLSEAWLRPDWELTLFNQISTKKLRKCQ